jgi:hypothetical membrane protein
MTAHLTVRVAIAWLVAALAVAHQLAPDDYWVASDTLSDLGAQGVANAWVSRAGFIGFGVLLAWHYSGDLVLVRRPWAQAVLLLMYGSTVALTGVFSTAPPTGTPFSEPESLLHTVFTLLAGICLAGAMLMSVSSARSRGERSRHLAALGVIAVTAGLFVALPEYQGVTERSFWLGVLWWVGRVGR